MTQQGWRLRRGIAIGLAVIAAGLGPGGPATTRAAEEVVHAARWIVDDAPVYLEIPRPNRWLDRLLTEEVRNTLSALPGVGDALRSEPYRKLAAEVRAVADGLGTSWEQGLRDLTGGGVVLAVETPPGEPPQVLLVVTPNDATLLKRLSEVIRDRVEANGQGDALKASEYRGAAVYEFRHGKPRGAYAIVGGKLVVVARGKGLESVIDRVLDGPGERKVLADNAEWKARRAELTDEAQAWGLVRLDRLRELAPKPFDLKGKATLPATFLFGAWLEAFLKADRMSGVLTWDRSGLGLELRLPTPPEGYRSALKGFVPPPGRNSQPPLSPPGTVVSVSLWRDLSSLWDARAELFPPEVVQGLAKLDGVAGQFFGGRDFGTGVLGALGHDWRLVIARQDHARLSPVPDLKLPAFALVVDLAPDDDDFAQRLKVAFQSFIGLANLGGAQSKAPPLELGSEVFEDVTIATAQYMKPRNAAEPTEPVHPRHNFSPSVAQVGNHFVLSSTVGLARDLIHGFKAPSQPQAATLMAEADGAELAHLVELNESRLVMQNMLEKGHDKAQAEREVAQLSRLLRQLGRGRLTVQDRADAVQFNLSFDLANPR